MVQKLITHKVGSKYALQFSSKNFCAIINTENVIPEILCKKHFKNIISLAVDLGSSFAFDCSKHIILITKTT